MPGMLKAKVDGQWVAVSAAGGGGGGGTDEVWVGPDTPGATVELWVDTDDPGALPNDARWNTAWGILGIGSFVGGSGWPVPAATMTKLTNDLAVNTVASRRYRMVLNIRVISATTGSGANFFPRGPGVTASAVDMWASASPGYSFVRTEMMFTGQGSVGAYYWEVNSSSAVTLFLDTMSSFYIEDIGPVSGSVAAPDPAPAWISPVMQNGWTQQSGFALVGYRKIGDIVYLRGNITGSSGNTAAFTLPAGYRVPANTYEFAAEYYTTSAVRAIQMVWTSPSGAVMIEAAGNVSLNNVSFSVTP